MDFTFSEPQTLLQNSINRFLAQRYDFEARQRIIHAGQGWDPQIWQAFAGELGLFGLTVPEADGGYGGGAVETMIVMEALGRALVVEPYLETVVIGGGLLRRAGGVNARQRIGEIMEGTTRLAFAAFEPGARYNPADIAAAARREGESWVLDGAKNMVAAAPLATHIIVPARISGARHDRAGIALFLVPRTTPGMVAHDYATTDDRRAADLTFQNMQLPASALLGAPGKALDLIEPVLDEALAALAAEAVGAMSRMLDDTVAYAKQRKQFGQPIGTFQVLQHRMVDMYMAIQQSIAAVYLATLKLDAPAAERQRAVSAAAVTIGKAARFVGQNAVQIHGGMGLADELAVGHYFKRLTVIEHSFGTVDHHLSRYAALSRAAAA